MIHATIRFMKKPDRLINKETAISHRCSKDFPLELCGCSWLHLEQVVRTCCSAKSFLWLQDVWFCYTVFFRVASSDAPNKDNILTVQLEVFVLVPFQHILNRICETLRLSFSGHASRFYYNQTLTLHFKKKI